MRSLAVVAVALGTSLAAPAAAYIVKGSVKCPDMVRQDANENYRIANAWWILGYFTGRNYEQDASVGQGIDAEALYDRVLSFCRNNPDKDMDDASNDLYRSLR